MAARELNLRSKELLTVSRLRMVKESNDKGRALGRLNLTDKDVAKISGWIEDDSITQDAYNERLNMILELGSEADKDAMSKVELASQGNELMALWEQVDRGDVKEDQAFEQADEAVRRRNSPMDQEQ
jgi:DNA topoisomerase VI subunit A